MLRLLTNIGGAHDGPLPVLSLVPAALGRCVVLSQPLGETHPHRDEWTAKLWQE